MMEISKDYNTCTRCVMDISDQDITFSEDGVCNYCRHYDEVISKKVLSMEEGN